MGCPITMEPVPGKSSARVRNSDQERAGGEREGGIDSVVWHDKYIEMHNSKPATT